MVLRVINLESTILAGSQDKTKRIYSKQLFETLVRDFIMMWKCSHSHADLLHILNTTKTYQAYQVQTKTCTETAEIFHN